MSRIVNIILFNVVLEVMAVILTSQSIYYLARYYRHIGNYYANLEDSAMRKIHAFLLAAILLLLTIFLMTIFIRKFIGAGTITFSLISLWLLILTFMICANAYGISLKTNALDALQHISGHSHSHSHNADSVEPNDSIAMLVLEWENRSDKPFCKEGLTLSDVAKDMHVNPRALSTHINHSMKINFSRWINTLRINEAKRMMEQDKEQKLVYIAFLCGFTDSAVFSRTFKAIEGCSPQTFKEIHGLQ